MVLPALVELKIAAGRLKDKADVVELIRANPEQSDALREHLTRAHASYADQFDTLLKEAGKASTER